MDLAPCRMQTPLLWTRFVQPSCACSISSLALSRAQCRHLFAEPAWRIPPRSRCGVWRRGLSSVRSSDVVLQRLYLLFSIWNQEVLHGLQTPRARVGAARVLLTLCPSNVRVESGRPRPPCRSLPLREIARRLPSRHSSLRENLCRPWIHSRSPCHHRLESDR